MMRGSLVGCGSKGSVEYLYASAVERPKEYGVGAIEDVKSLQSFGLLGIVLGRRGELALARLRGNHYIKT